MNQPPPQSDLTQATPTLPTSSDEVSPERLELHIPLITFVKVFAAAMVAYVAYVLWPLLLLVFLALFLAVTLHAFAEWLDARGMKHQVSLVVVIGSLLITLAVSMALLFPALLAQATAFSQNLPRLHEEALKQLPMGESVRQGIDDMLDNADWSQANAWFGHFWSASGIALNGISEVALLLVIALYLLIDGSKIFEWFLAFFSPLKRAKMRLTAEEISTVIFGYVAGQVITSLVVAIYTYVVLSVLHVPGALLLAILAGILDILPILGIIFAIVPAFLLALSVSPKTAVIVVGLYLLFHALEVYFIVPKIYGRHLRVSTLTVLLGLLAGTLLAGIPGALAALPVIASYAAIERIWLKPYLRDGVSEKHELQKERVFGDKA